MKLPSHIKNIEIEKFRAPATNLEKELPFGLLEPHIFERFCCDLIYSRVERELGDDIIEILPIGVSGQKQYGADIFVKHHVRALGKYSLYEVKRVKSYTITEYRKTIERFLSNYDNWGFDIAEFNLLVSEDISAEEIALWQREAAIMSQKSIIYRVIPASTINKWVKSFPELVYKYFHIAWTEMLFGKAAIWHIENYGIWRYEEPATWNGYREPTKNIYGNNLSYINDHVKIHAFLPSLEKNSANCHIEFRNGRFSHVMITLSHQQLVESFFIAANIPISDANRPFLIKAQDSDGYYCDIGNCRIRLSLAEVRSLCDALDVFWEEYRKQVHEIEDSWKSRYFNYHSKSIDDIPLLRIKRGLWRLLLGFAESHDAFNTTGEWSLFDSCPSWLKIFTNHDTKTMDAGYHAFIKPRTYEWMVSDYKSADDDVLLVWQPPNGFVISSKGTVISPRNYWDAETTHNWLRDHLIPRVLKWSNDEKNNSKLIRVNDFVRNLFKKKEVQENVYNPDDYIRSFFMPYPSRNVQLIEDVDGLLFVINKLQSFFSGNSNSIYIDSDSYKKLYRSLGEALSKSELNDFLYLHGNLNYLVAEDMESLIAAINSHALECEGGCDNSFRIDCVFRCIQVSLRDGRSYLNNQEIRDILNNLYPLIEIMESRELLARQSKFFE